MTIDIPVSVSTKPKNYGFVIDNRKCIGCHACSTACKSENEVPLGVYRTWVKYVETGAYPDTRRHFQVTRCNHCANPPCVRICPTQAMYQRADGIVEFDNNVCIGCKACMQACPYDAIHIDPETNTAAKCHYCAHRTDIGLEPACVVVCPEHAIIAGDMNDPSSEISHILARQDVTVRKPEQGTSPKVFYIDGNDVLMHPTAVPRTPETFMWADVMPLHGGEEEGHHTNGHNGTAANGKMRQHSNGTPLRQPQPQGQPSNGPIQFGSTVAEHMVQVGYNAQHKIPWHWPVPAYLVTKGLAAGVFMILALGWLFDWFAFDGLTAVAAGITSVVFMLLTTAFLVYDLERPERFLFILLRPQWNSWLTRGTVFLIGFSTIAGIWWLLETLNYVGILSVADPLRPFFLVVGFFLAVGVAVYTAFLFAQAEGRDLWQSSLLPFHLIVQAFVMGSAALLIIAALFNPSLPFIRANLMIFALALILDLFLVLAGEFGIPHATEVAAQAAHEISHGRYRRYFWGGSITIGHIVPLLLVVAVSFFGGGPLVLILSALAAIVGMYTYEYAFVMAPQDIPNS